MARFGSLWQAVAKAERTRIKDDLAVYHRHGGKRLWSQGSHELRTIPKLAATERRLGEMDARDVTRAVKDVIEEAIESLEEPDREGARAHFGYADDADRPRTKTQRELQAAKVYGLRDSKSYRNRVAKLGGRSRLEATEDNVAAALVELDDAVRGEGDRGALKRDDENAVEHTPPDLEGLASVWDHVRAIALPPLQSLTGAGFRTDVQADLRHLHRSYRLLEQRKTVFSGRDALTLRRIHYDAEDTVYVLSRRDEAPGFRQQPDWPDYVEFLERRVQLTPRPPIEIADDVAVANAPEPGINQIRIVVAEDARQGMEMAAELRHLHRSGTLFFFPRALLSRYSALDDCQFGFQLSKESRYAMISIPPETRPHDIDPDDIPGAIKRRRYDIGLGNMQALLTCDEELVGDLLDEIEDLLQSRDVKCIPSGAKHARAEPPEASSYVEDAIALACDAVARGDRPFGAVLVRDGKVLAKGKDVTLTTGDPTAHAEISAIRAAVKAVGLPRVAKSTLYTSCEPCVMCAAAIARAGVTEVYYGADRAVAHAHGLADVVPSEHMARAVLGSRSFVLRVASGADEEPFVRWDARHIS